MSIRRTLTVFALFALIAGSGLAKDEGNGKDKHPGRSDRAMTKDEAGVGYGILLYRFDKKR